MTGPGDANEVVVREEVVLAKYDQDTEGMTSEEISQLDPVETIKLIDGEIVEHWFRDE